MKFVRFGRYFVNLDYVKTIQVDFEKHKGKFYIRFLLANPRETQESTRRMR